MPLDAVCLQAVVAELAPQITGSRIEKIQQPARDQVVLLLRGNRRLLLSAGGGQPRLHMTELPRDNPAQPPMFCMLLRKYLSGGIIESIQQAPLERVVTLTVSAADELGERSQFSLILEAVARRANLILADKDGHIIDCLRRIDFEMNPDRQVLPGLFYHLPTPPDKVSPFTVTEEEFAALAAAAGEGAPADQWLVRTVNGLSPLVARELTFRACGSTDAPVTGHTGALWSAFGAWRDTVNEKHFTPAMLKHSGVPMDFTYLHVGQYGGAAEEEMYTSFSRLLDDFYEKREQAERVKQKGQDLVKTASNGAARLRRKIAAQEQELAESKNRDKWRVYGELITANLYRMERGMSRLTAQNYYDPDCADVDIPLDVRLSPQENAAKYFKKYTKAKTAEKYITAQLEKARVELTYLESVLQELTLAESEQDFNDIRAELTDGGYLRAKGRKQPQRPSKPREFHSTAGLRILVGRNNRQNDRLTAKDAEKWDIWLHTQRIHGSHVILCTGGAQPDEQSIAEAASLAAYFSQAQNSTKVPVDFTQVKFVKKPAGSPPGFVNYTNYKTILADPSEELVKRLGGK
ncbi:Rqc2 family fibronectin-binding protein [Vescimonas sp.]|uniref:Rqc2 family fibronectin-binding protein n=1 Tax=Vescimonas sp. TaxID=2892404 RepID=UPI003F7DB84B